MQLKNNFLKTERIINGRKYNYRKDGQSYTVFLTLANTTGNVPYEVRFSDQQPINVGTFEKDTYETQYGYRATFNDSWVLSPRFEGESIDLDFDNNQHGNYHGYVKARYATGKISYTTKCKSAKKLFLSFVDMLDQWFAETIRERDEPVVNAITKEYTRPYDEPYYKPKKATYIRITNDVEKIRFTYGIETAERVAGNVYEVESWRIDSKTLHHRPQCDVNAVVSREELNGVHSLGTFTFGSGLAFYPHMFEVVAFEVIEDDEVSYYARGDRSGDGHLIDGPHDTLEDALAALPNIVATTNAQGFRRYRSTEPEPEPEPVVEPVWDEDEVWNHGAYVISSGGSIEFNPYAEKMDGYYDMTSLELIQEGLMKALLDVQRRISQQAMDDVKEASQ